jgi:hypothetical protein
LALPGAGGGKWAALRVVIEGTPKLGFSFLLSVRSKYYFPTHFTD